MISPDPYGRDITPARRAILTQLAAWRFLTTSQLHQLVQPEKKVQQTQGDLARLREWGMIESFAAEPDRGAASPYCWLLLQKGADVIGTPGYGSHYRRKPTRERLQYREQELELEAQVRAAAWDYMPPVTYSKAHPMPDATPHYRALVNMLEHMEYAAVHEAEIRNERTNALNQRIVDYNAKLYRAYPPKTANDYVIHRTTPHRAAVLILCPPSATAMFWRRRIEAYQTLAKHLFVIAVFANEAQAIARRDPIKKAGLRVTDLSRLPTLLKALRDSTKQG